MKTVIVLTLGLLAASPVLAGTLENFTAAETKYVEAWNGLPLTQRSVKFITEKAQGFGGYTARTSNTFKAGEPIVTYFEPIGFKSESLAGGKQGLNMVLDFRLTDPAGAVLYEQPGMLTYERQFQSVPHDMELDVNLQLDGAPAGKYVLVWTLTDKVSGQQSTFKQDMEIADAS
jgi:hypothetical protein